MPRTAYTCTDDDSNPYTDVHGPKWWEMVRQVERGHGCRIMVQVCTVCGYFPNGISTVSARVIDALLSTAMIVEKEETEQPEWNGSDTDSTLKYGIGDSMPFKLTAILPDNISVYDAYRLVFRDSMTDG